MNCLCALNMLLLTLVLHNLHITLLLYIYMITYCFYGNTSINQHGSAYLLSPSETICTICSTFSVGFPTEPIYTTAGRLR